MPAGKTYTFETNWEYDSWNRLKTISYPDGEIVSYNYNNATVITGIEDADNLNLSGSIIRKLIISK